MHDIPMNAPRPEGGGPRRGLRALVPLAVLLAIAGCARRAPLPPPAESPAPPPAVERPAPGPEAPPGMPRPYRVFGRWYVPLADARGFRQRGIASWYGPEFHGKRASSGEVYNMHELTAAHKTLPLGTLVRVRHLENRRTVEVRINDRGPFVGERIIDLSYEAARRLEILGPGTAPVEIEAIAVPEGAPVDLFSGTFTFQVGAFTQRENAERLRERLETRYGNAHIVETEVGGVRFFRLRVGRCTHLDEAAAWEARLRAEGFRDAFVVAE